MLVRAYMNPAHEICMDIICVCACAASEFDNALFVGYHFADGTYQAGVFVRRPVYIVFVCQQSGQEHVCHRAELTFASQMKTMKREKKIIILSVAYSMHSRKRDDHK